MSNSIGQRNFSKKLMGHPSSRENQVDRGLDQSKGINISRLLRNKDRGVSDLKSEAERQKGKRLPKKAKLKPSKQGQPQPQRIEDLLKTNAELKKQLDSFQKRIDQYERDRADLRRSQEKVGKDNGALLLDISTLFDAMESVIKSNRWFNDKNSLRQLEMLIRSGRGKIR